ncbi:hypothetical protein [Paenarthrobacter sp. JL.01a]|uniref:hypothetical protein n=1 Tax=Paenarthrobacter sp. JL.01a TaxID=2979324 RepID=UPI0021C59E46|nr:hypothetical protein [Paenarthrobacter sp. JL.01a]UXM90925.1 hypothetical protein N5P29_16740 [Paenarthrobacter sp. JL.01a]
MTTPGIPALLEPIQERWAAVGDLDQWYAPEEIQEALEHAGTASEHIGPDSMAIAHAGTDTARLLAAVKAVERTAQHLDRLADGDRHYANLFRSAVEAALRGEA